MIDSQGAKHARLLSVAGVRGSRMVDNEEMCTMIDSSDEWIQQRTGIAERRWATDAETPLSMATAAARQAIEKAGLTPAQIDGLLVSTVSHHQPSPSLAVAIARELEISDAAAYDISAACAGFCYLVEQASALVKSGSATNVLIIGVEKLSEMLNTSDRSTAFLFADGAGAAVVGPSDTPGIGPVVWGSDPESVEVIQIQDWRDAEEMPLISMEGNKVFKWATTFIAEKAAEALDTAGVTPEELDVFIPHQANNRITDAMLRRLKLPETVKVSRDIKQMGNVSAASIPIAMDAMLNSGEAKSGQLALIIGFGAGLVYAGQVVELP